MNINPIYIWLDIPNQGVYIGGWERCIGTLRTCISTSETSEQGREAWYRGQNLRTGEVTNRYSPTHWARVIGVSSMHHAITMGYPLSMMHRSYQQWFELSVWVLWRLYWSLWWPYIGEYHEVLVTFMTYDHLGCVLFFGHDSSNRPIYLQIWAYISSIYICMSSAYHTHV